MNLQFTRQAKKDFTVFDRKDRNRIIAALYKLQADPHSGDLKRLKGRSDMWRLRVGEIRVILWNDKLTQILYVMGIEPRKDAYR
jgi:mRNA interferase RelE/StbE